MGGIIWIIIVGFVAGIIARWLSPGPNNPSGFILTVVLGIVAIILGVVFEKINVAFMVGLAFAVAASANFPVLALSLFFYAWGEKTYVVVLFGSIVANYFFGRWVEARHGRRGGRWVVALDDVQYPGDGA